MLKYFNPISVFLLIGGFKENSFKRKIESYEHIDYAYLHSRIVSNYLPQALGLWCLPLTGVRCQDFKMLGEEAYKYPIIIKYQIEDKRIYK